MKYAFFLYRLYLTVLTCTKIIVHLDGLDQGLLRKIWTGVPTPSPKNGTRLNFCRPKMDCWVQFFFRVQFLVLPALFHVDNSVVVEGRISTEAVYY